MTNRAESSAGLSIGSLFSGIGGLELGLEWAGVGETAWQVEQDPYCLKVLARHWPNAARYSDVREVGAHNLPPVDVICGGFPCQDISDAGLKAGIDGEQSGLWSEYARIIRELRPRYVVVENVAALFVRGFGRVLGDLASLGYDAEWSVVSACAVGAPHTRERVFVVAYTDGSGRPEVVPHNGHVLGGAGDHAAAVALGSRRRIAGEDHWGRCGESPLLGVADGRAAVVDRLHALGNAVSPQVAEKVGRRLRTIHAALRAEAA